MPEEWKDIPNYEGHYQVSNLGRVRSLKSNLILKPMIARNGYLEACLWKHNKQKKYLIHRLVANLFIDNPNSYTEINHIDENKTNNNASNLEWCTHLYNMNYGEVKQKISNARKSGKRTFTPELLAKYSEASSNRKWVTNGNGTRLVKDYDLQEFLNENKDWRLGRR